MDMVIPQIPQLLTTLAGFLLLVWILAKFAWGPIIGLLDRRRDQIRQEYADAEQTRAAADTLKGDFEARLSDIKLLERERVQEAVNRGEELAKNIVTGARLDADTAREKVHQELEIETQKAQLELRDTVVALAITAAEKVIHERLDDDQHRRLIRDYIDHLGELPHA
ncbi:MAG: F0F1 ATP synthase subunit B [Candidatus Krumholzibacteriia bacterium]